LAGLEQPRNNARLEAVQTNDDDLLDGFSLQALLALCRRLFFLETLELLEEILHLLLELFDSFFAVTLGAA
jgi:hypothetical protein